MDAAIAGGFRIVEFTLNTPGALDAIAACRDQPDLCVGAGTVLCVEDARRALEAGARFLVSPVADEDLLAFCAENDVFVVPGVLTPAELLTAHRRGAHLLKLFPGPQDLPTYLRTVLGPMPFLKIFPTSGVTLENARTTLEAGAFGLGFVNCLFAAEDLAERRFQAIEDRARQMVLAVESARIPG